MLLSALCSRLLRITPPKGKEQVGELPSCSALLAECFEQGVSTILIELNVELSCHLIR